MVVKMIQNLRNKVEVQVNKMEAKIEKIQEIFNKDLYEIKNGQLAMKHTITMIKIH